MKNIPLQFGNLAHKQKVKHSPRFRNVLQVVLHHFQKCDPKRTKRKPHSLLKLTGKKYGDGTDRNGEIFGLSTSREPTSHHRAPCTDLETIFLWLCFSGYPGQGSHHQNDVTAKVKLLRNTNGRILPGMQRCWLRSSVPKRITAAPRSRRNTGTALYLT